MMSVGNVDELNPRKEVIESNVETQDKTMGSKKAYLDIGIHRNKRCHDVGMESSRDPLYKNDNLCPDLCRSSGDASVDIVMTTRYYIYWAFKKGPI